MVGIAAVIFSTLFYIKIKENFDSEISNTFVFQDLAMYIPNVFFTSMVKSRKVKEEKDLLLYGISASFFEISTHIMPLKVYLDLMWKMKEFLLKK
jgi:hypothetical protein